MKLSLCSFRVEFPGLNQHKKPAVVAAGIKFGLRAEFRVHRDKTLLVQLKDWGKLPNLGDAE
ncbi:hypothetical protein GCM10007895_11110 [Paraferrimonas sedimenticola]|uniref:Uncharacterized protein n=1 Tax=Paraferrimonas sedimenticola TaxID=375674 RepID=A0AA37RV47_9GAMM|nr:hypothetical protein GCM10007895_11110 [Paraferrimonas sedimenticola]